MRIISPTGRRLYFNNKNIVSDAPPPPPPPPPPIPTSITIAGQDYAVVRIGNQLWTARNLDLNTSTKAVRNANYNCRYYYMEDLNVKINQYLQENGLTTWRVPFSTDYRTLVDFVKSDNGLRSDAQVCTVLYKSGSYYVSSNDKYGFSLVPAGACRATSTSYVNTGTYGNANMGYILSTDTSNSYRAYFGNGGSSAFGMGRENDFRVTVRLVMDVPT